MTTPSTSRRTQKNTPAATSTAPAATTSTPTTRRKKTTTITTSVAVPSPSAQDEAETTSPAPTVAAPAPVAPAPARRSRARQSAPVIETPSAPAAAPFTTTVQRNHLKLALAVASRVIPDKPTLPILGHVLLRSDGQCLTIEASDLRMMVSYRVLGMPSGAGAVTLPARLLADFVAALPSCEVQLQCDPGAQETALRCGGSQATIKGWDVEDFPLPPAIDGTAPTFQLDASVLRTAIPQVVFAASLDEARPALTGVLMELQDRQVRLWASDGFLMARKTIPLDEVVSTPQRLLIPAVALAELAELLTDDTELVRFTVAPGGGQLLMETAGATIICRLLDSKFPDLQRVIPQHAATRVVVARDEARQAVRLAAVFASSNAHATRLTVEEAADGTTGRLVLAANAAELGNTSATLAAQLTGPATTVGMSSRFLKTVLGVVPTPQIALELDAGRRPVVLRPVGDDSLLIIVMPMTLSN